MNLITQGYAECSFRLEGLIQAARLFRCKASFTIENMQGSRIAFPFKSIKLSKLALHIAIKSVRHWGATTISEIAAQLEEQTGSGVDAGFLVKCLSHQKGFAWLDQSTGWFWLKSRRSNRLLARITKILAVAGSVDISELRAGVARPHRMKGFAPPRRVLLELCRQIQGWRVQDKCVIATTPIDWKKVLRDVERNMVEVLKEHGPLMQRARFEQFCIDRGMKRATFYGYLEYSPVIERYADGVYGLRGATVPLGLIESLIPKHQRPVTVRVDHGWTQDGKIFISYRLSRAMLASGCFGIPGGLKGFLQGEFLLKATDDQRTGRVVVKGSSGWGIGSFFRRRGGEEGDIFLLLFNLATREAIANIGDESLLEDREIIGAETLDQETGGTGGAVPGGNTGQTAE